MGMAILQKKCKAYALHSLKIFISYLLTKSINPRYIHTRYQEVDVVGTFVGNY